MPSAAVPYQDVLVRAAPNCARIVPANEATASQGRRSDLPDRRLRLKAAASARCRSAGSAATLVLLCRIRTGMGRCDRRRRCHGKRRGDKLEPPPSLVRLLVAGAGALGEGDSIAPVSEEAEVSPAEAAKLRGVSRQQVDQLVANGILPARQLPHSRYPKIPAGQCWPVARRRVRSAPGSLRSSKQRIRLAFPTHDAEPAPSCAAGHQRLLPDVAPRPRPPV